ncbi:ectoine synthase [Chromobacterium paludis]|uniref:L-ectoine synthase n=1 Tax=Chromobacterium paludis TaxID=2605945 RepID=A0A5C1DJD3_9NEIS|nr:ectoine synthase [Chromobacterium paludis]QEL56673.1 ectoine synthase [Chromobacterium paludis]
MIVRHLQQLLGTARDVDGGNWISRRLLTADDGMGFSMHDTIIKAGTETPIWYKHHLEAVYCISGKGEIELTETGETFAIEPGMLYALNLHDRHLLRASETLHLVCVFNPPVTGREVHDEDGAYAPSPAAVD